MNSRTIARFLVQECLKQGATNFQVWSEGETIFNRPTIDVDSIVSALHACDDADLVVHDVNGARLGRFLFIPSNGDDAISDYGINTFADSVFEATLARIDDCLN